MVLQAEKNGSCGLSPISDDEVDKDLGEKSQG